MMKGIQNEQIFQNDTFLSLAFEKKSELKTATFVNDSQPGVVSTLTYTVDGDNVVKQTAHNVADPEVLNNTADAVKSVLEETYKGYRDLKG